MMRRALLLLPLLCACSAGYLPGSGDAGTSSPDGGAQTTGSIKLRSIETLGTMKISGTTAKAGSFFAQVHVELENQSTAATPMTFASFTLEVEGGAAYAASTLTSQVTSGCASAVSVEPKGKHDCWVAFEIPLAKPATVLHYKTATATDIPLNVTIAPPSTAGKLACDYARLSQAVLTCGSCIQTYCSETVTTYSNSECSTGQSCTTASYCNCERSAQPSIICSNIYDQIQTCIAKSCSECIVQLSNGEGGGG
jgi:hypothetical protein